MTKVVCHEGFFYQGIYPGHSRYLAPSEDTEVMCEAESPNEYVCTREPGHDGDHAAHGCLGQCFERWPR